MSNSGKRYTAEQIIHTLREIDVLSSNGQSLQMACKQAGISEQSYYRWRK
jgi:putative transposase